jgi:small subunit ribosomal protein S20
MKTMIKKLRETIESGNREGAQELFPRVSRIIDRAVAKGAIHKNTGSRYKSRLTKQVKSMSAQAG